MMRNSPLTPPDADDTIHLMMRGRAVVARRAHNPEVAGSSPVPANNPIMVI